MRAYNSSFPEPKVGLSQKKRKKESMNLRDCQICHLTTHCFPGTHFEAHSDISFEAFTTNPTDKEYIRHIRVLDSHQLAEEVQASPGLLLEPRPPAPGNLRCLSQQSLVYAQAHIYSTVFTPECIHTLEIHGKNSNFS